MICSFESLEQRTLLSITPVPPPVNRDPLPASAGPVDASPLAAASLTNVVGTYTGSIAVQGVHTQPVKVVIATQAGDGTISGTLTTPNAPSMRVQVNGKVATNGTMTMKLSNETGHLGGSITGNGSGTISQTGTQTKLSLNFNFTQPFLDSGTMTLTAPRTSSASITVAPPASQTAVAGRPKAFALGSFTQSHATGPFKVDVNWGDGSAHTKFAQASAGTIAAHTHTFTKAGSDVVSVSVTDSKGHVSNTAKFNVVVSPAAAAKLVFTKEPHTTVAGKVISPAVAVAIEDAFGNVVTTNSSTVTISKLSGPAGSTLLGTLAVAAVKGVATFSNLMLKKAGSYLLKASDGTLAAATSSRFTVTPSAAAKIAFVHQPARTTHGQPISPAVQVAIEDKFGNVVTTNTSKVTITKNSGPTGSTLTGTLSTNAVKGVATFANLILNKPGSYTLKAIDGTFTATSATFAVV